MWWRQIIFLLREVTVIPQAAQTEMVNIKGYKNHNIPKTNNTQMTLVFPCKTGHIYGQLRTSTPVNL